MKITEYPTTTSLVSGDSMIVDGTQGTRQVKGSEMPYAIMDLCGPEMHRMIYRGKNLGTSVSPTQLSAIQDGTFKDLWLGDYWVINNETWRIADFDYWYNVGDTKFTNHHLVIVPDGAPTSASMNSTSTTNGGYTQCAIRTGSGALIGTVKTIVESAFPGMLKTHREYLINTVTSGYPSNGAWTDSDVDLMNEPMVYGSYIYTPSSGGTTDVKRYTNSNQQLALFAVKPSFKLSGNGYWLRDVASATHFARVDSNGGATSTGAANSYGIRPAFAIG